MSTLRSALTLRFGLILVATAVVAAGFGTFIAGADASTHPADVESPEVQPVSDPTQIANGMTTDGNSWTAVRYDTAGGLVCVDVNVTGPATGGVTQSVGGCFDREAPVTQRGSATIANGAAAVVFGVLEGATRSPSNSARDLRITFNSGAVVAPSVSADGIFVGAGAGLPLTLEYLSSAGEAWRHAYDDGRPRG